MAITVEISPINPISSPPIDRYSAFQLAAMVAASPAAMLCGARLARPGPGPFQKGGPAFWSENNRKPRKLRTVEHVEACLVGFNLF